MSSAPASRIIGRWSLVVGRSGRVRVLTRSSARFHAIHPCALHFCRATPIRPTRRSANVAPQFRRPTTIVALDCCYLHSPDARGRAACSGDARHRGGAGHHQRPRHARHTPARGADRHQCVRAAGGDATGDAGHTRVAQRHRLPEGRALLGTAAALAHADPPGGRVVLAARGRDHPRVDGGVSQLRSLLPQRLLAVRRRDVRPRALSRWPVARAAVHQSWRGEAVLPHPLADERHGAGARSSVLRVAGRRRPLHHSRGAAG